MRGAVLLSRQSHAGEDQTGMTDTRLNSESAESPVEPDDADEHGADGTGDPAVKTRRRAPGADPVVRSFGTARTCAADDCETRLSRYNPDSYCSMHRGWDRQVVTRRRRADDDD
jgi:hypothetical protein